MALHTSLICKVQVTLVWTYIQICHSIFFVQIDCPPNIYSKMPKDFLVYCQPKLARDAGRNCFWILYWDNTCPTFITTWQDSCNRIKQANVFHLRKACHISDSKKNVFQDNKSISSDEFSVFKIIHLVIIIKPVLLHFVYLLLSKIITKIFSGKAKREKIFDKEGMVLRYSQIMILGGTLGFETNHYF